MSDKAQNPVLTTSHLGIDFGGLTAVDNFNLTLGRTEIVLKFFAFRLLCM